jgi:hypothetical protein
MAPTDTRRSGPGLIFRLTDSENRPPRFDAPGREISDKITIVVA